MKVLSDVCELIIDCEHKTAPTAPDGYPSIRTPNVGRGRLLLDNVNRVNEETYRAWTKRAVPKPGDLIIAREAPLGNVAIITKGLQVCLGQRTVLVRPDKAKVDPLFLTYFLLSDYAQHRFVAAANGSTVPHLNMRDIRGLPLPELPPIQLQQRIGAILSAYDDLIENNTRRIAILEEMARRLFDSTAGGFGRRETRLLGELVFEVRDPVDPSVLPSATPYVGLEHLPRRSTTLREWGRAEEVASLKLRFLPNDILFGKIRPYFHKVAIAPIAGVCSSDAIVLRCRRAEDRAFVLSCVSSDPFIAHAVQTSNGTKMPRANWTVLQNWPVPKLTEAELRRFGAAVGPMIDLCCVLAAQNRRLRAARDLLLPKLISGEIEVGAAPLPEAAAAE
jgi:type I restriction enzyme S subunit